MFASRRMTHTTLAAALTVASLALPGAALARGGGTGGGGGGATTPAPTPAPTVQPVLCDYSLDGMLPDGSTIFSNQANDAGCLTVRMSGASLSVYKIALTPGWTDVITSNGAGTSSRVAVTFTETATGRTVEARIEFGKTVIK